jgi:hypothetical protein
MSSGLLRRCGVGLRVLWGGRGREMRGGMKEGRVMGRGRMGERDVRMGERGVRMMREGFKEEEEK